MLIDILERVHPEVVGLYCAQALIDHGHAPCNHPLAGEIQTALEAYRDQHSDDERTLRELVTVLQERLHALLSDRRTKLQRAIDTLDAELGDLEEVLRLVP